MNIFMKILSRVLSFLSQGKYKVFDSSKYSLYDRSKCLLIMKNKFIVSLRDDIDFKENFGYNVTVDNLDKSWDKFWGNKTYIEEYSNDESRETFINEVYSIINEQIKDGIILDVGCGSGIMLKKMYNEINDIKKVKFIGLDFSIKSIEYCRKNINNVEFAKGDIFDLKYEDNSIDNIICMEVLEHIKQPKKAFNELYRVCKMGGKLFITIPNGEIDEYYGHINFWSINSFNEFLNVDNTILKDIDKKRSILCIITK